MSRYQVTLTPLDWFFFGGEQTFDNGDGQSFIAFSNRMPQQTSILGMVRYQLLKQNHLLLTGEKEIDDHRKPQIAMLVGENSFDIEATAMQSFGKIKRLSPVFVLKGTKQLYPRPLTHGIDIGFKKEDVWMSGKRCDQILCAPSFVEKDYYNYCQLIDKDNKPYDIEGDEGVFSTSMQIGITKADNNDKNEDGFFKQETVRFRNTDTSFAFFLELEDDITLKDDIVFVGAQRSCFQMKVTSPSIETFIPEHPRGSILLLSPAFIRDREGLDNNCIQCWSGTTHFRNLRQSSGGNLHSGFVKYKRQTSLCTFLSAGSIIFYRDEKQRQEIENKLNIQNLQMIGYNHFSVK